MKIPASSPGFTGTRFPQPPGLNGSRAWYLRAAALCAGLGVAALTIDLPVAAMAKRAVELLLQRIAGESGPPRCEYLT